ncbi:hypothetical protein [Mongoliitalea lutea]|uniref:tRNA (Guanine-N1)-methyltransferase n=1 Tax=Mongoliitalea lutea TaxID=849756 RepID=A0A8J3G7D9_9BACT|nr:hypothetical protein [Mongoliitalea lutea]GHB52406.1 hypothetical protein GCM10008106_36360 [Mongoliitalea lutea]
MKINYFIALLLSLCQIVEVKAQDEQPMGSLTSGTIASQFEYVNSISNNYQEFKVIKKTHMDQLKKNVVDSLKVFQQEIASQKEELRSQQTQLAEVNKDLLALKESLEEAEAARDNFSFLSFPIHKSAYNTLVWSIIGGLALALVFFLYRFFQSHRVVEKARKDLEETMEEFEQHRRNTLERERKLKRELVDALNKKTA